MANFITLLAPAGELVLNLDDEILRETLVTRGGEVVHHRIRELVQSLPASG